MKTSSVVMPINFVLPQTLVTLGLASLKSSLSKSADNPGMPVHNVKFEILAPDDVQVPDPTGAGRTVRLAGKQIQMPLCENDDADWGSARIIELFTKAGILLPAEVEPLTGLIPFFRQLPAIDAIVTSKAKFAVGPDGKPMFDSRKQPIITHYELQIVSFVEASAVPYTQPNW